MELLGLNMPNRRAFLMIWRGLSIPKMERNSEFKWLRMFNTRISKITDTCIYAFRNHNYVAHIYMWKKKFFVVRELWTIESMGINLPKRPGYISQMCFPDLSFLLFPFIISLQHFQNCNLKYRISVFENEILIVCNAWQKW